PNTRRIHIEDNGWKRPWFIRVGGKATHAAIVGGYFEALLIHDIVILFDFN
ncbi:MAG: hypothetical protein ACI9NY_002292, partial [Kiritimatiellia bacterium]